MLEIGPRVQPAQKLHVHVEFLGQFCQRACVGEAGELGHLLQVYGDQFVKRSGEVRVGDRIRLQHRLRNIRSQRIPGAGVENSGGGQVIGLLKSSDGASVVVAVHAVNFARREMVSIKEHFGFRDQRRVAVVLAAWRGGVDRCSGDLRAAPGVLCAAAAVKGVSAAKKKQRSSESCQNNPTHLDPVPGAADKIRTHELTQGSQWA